MFSLTPTCITMFGCDHSLNRPLAIGTLTLRPSPGPFKARNPQSSCSRPTFGRQSSVVISPGKHCVRSASKESSNTDKKEDRIEALSLVTCLKMPSFIRTRKRRHLGQVQQSPILRSFAVILSNAEVGPHDELLQSCKNLQNSGTDFDGSQAGRLKRVARTRSLTSSCTNAPHIQSSVLAVESYLTMA